MAKDAHLSPAVSVLSAAKFIGQYSQWSLSNLQMQRILYVAQIIQMGRHDRPLVHGLFEANLMGAVHPVLHKHVEVFGAAPVRNLFRREANIDPDSDAAYLLREVVDRHAVDPLKFVGAANAGSKAWINSFDHGEGTAISNQALKKEYDQQYEKKENPQVPASLVDAEPAP